MGQRKNKTFQERCEEVYEFFMGYYERNNIGPTYTEMSAGTGITRGNLNPIIKQLVEDKKLTQRTKTARGLWPAETSAHGFSSVHWVGHIAADNLNPLLVMDLLDHDSTIEVPKYLLPKKVGLKDLYALQVKGDSMLEVNIMDGDYVIMQSGNAFRDDDIVAVLIKEENAVTLKILKQTERGSAKLQPKSHKHNPRIEDREDLEIQGRVVAVMRKCW